MTYNPTLQSMRRNLSLVALVASLLFLPRVSAAQSLMGALAVTVHDEQGLALAGATVTVSSPALIGGPIPRIADAKGQLRFLALPPGLYVVEVTMPEFQLRKVTDVGIKMGETLDLTLVLKRNSIAVTVDVATSSTDARDPGFETRFDASTISAIPTRRNGLFGLLSEAPGVSPTSQATTFVSVFGSGVDQNLSLVDGTNVTATSNGIMRSEPGIDFIQEIQVQSIGASAEYGNAQGGVFNILTRQGSNAFLWDGSYYAQPRGLTSQPFMRLINGGGTLQSGYERRRYRDATTTLGGPVVRDRLWFFAGYQSLRDEDSQPGADPRHPKRYQQDKVFGKLTWRLTPGWQLVQSFHEEFWDNRETPTATKTVGATQRLHARVPAMTFGHLTHTSSSNSLWDVRLGRFVFSQDIDAVEEVSQPGRLNRQTNVSSGAPSQVGAVRQERWTAKATFNYYRTNLWGTDHELRIGGQWDRGEHRSLLIVPLGERYEDNGPTSRVFLSGPSNSGGLAVTSSAFVTDAIRLGARVTVSAGLRFDHSVGISPDIERLDAERNATGETITGDGTLYTWNVVSPRVGVAVRLTSDGRTVLRSSYGRFYQGILTGELSPDHPGVAAMTRFDVDPATGDRTNRQVMDPKLTVQIDPNTRAPRTDASSIGLDRTVGGPVSVGIVYAHKKGRDFIGWEDIRGTYLDESRTPIDGQTVPVKVLTGMASTRLFNLTNAAGYSLTYDGVAMTFDKRRSRGWQANGSYTWSRATGLQPSSGTTAAGAQVATTGAPPVSFAPPVTFGRDPNTTLRNADGRLPNDRPHLFRLMGSVDVPKVGISVAANLQHASGKPWAYTADITPSAAQDVVRILLEPRGSRRLSSQTVLDLRLSRAFALAGAGRIELRLDVLNALNDAAEESIATDLFNSDTRGVGTIFLDPRRAMLSVKINLGQ